MTILQVFCTVAEIHDGSDLRGSEREQRIFEKILSASQFLAMRAGRFLPVTETRTVGAGRYSLKLFLPFELLSVTSVVNDGTALTGSDYLLRPNGGHWDNGPYSWLEIDAENTNVRAWDEESSGIVITGDVGLYASVMLTGATLGASMTDSATTMRVSNGAEVSPGAMLRIGTERIFVRKTGVPVSAVTTLGAALDANSEICTFTDGSLVNAGEIIRVGVEQMKVLDVSSNTGYLQRGWNKTTKTSHLISAAVDVYRNFTVDRGVNGSTAAAHDSAAAISREMVPADVNELCRKIAMRMLKDSGSGYAGRVGDESTGQSIYTYILPHELDEVLERYHIPRAG